jgi:hypothetical protein
MLKTSRTKNYKPKDSNKPVVKEVTSDKPQENSLKDTKDYIDNMITEGLLTIVKTTDSVIGASFMTLSITEEGLFLHKNGNMDKLRLHLPFSPPKKIIGYKANIRGWDEVSVMFNN